MPPAKILNVGLDDSLRTTRESLLMGAGYDVVSVGTWDAFERACGTQSFDLLILGQTLPPSLKHDMFDFMAAHCPGAKVAEIYTFAASLPAQFSFRASDPPSFLTFIAQALATK